jgi:hypothetical protein
MITNTPRRLLRRAAAAAFAAVLGTTVACSDFLVAENPGAIEVDDLNQVAYTSLLANAPIGALQNSLDDLTYWNGQFTDELINRNAQNPFVEEGQIDRRELRSDMSYIPAFIYSPMQRARFLAEDATERLGIILGDSASRDVRVARSQAYAGLAYVYLGEAFCTTPIDVGVPKSSAEMFADAIGYFDDAIGTAEAAKAYQLGLTPPGNATATAADSVRWLALVGAARAALNRNDKAQAIAYASQVPANFEFYSYYSANSSAQHHRTYNRLTLGNNATLVGTPFEAMAGDPRVPRTTTAGARLGTPLSPPSYSTYTGTLPGGAFAADMSMRIASGLEARYIIAEAEGPTPATLTFVNARRAAGGQLPVALAGDALMAELRDQRARDFYLDNHRLGDLRRYLEFQGVDLFPKGAYPGTTTGQVYDESVYCWPLPTNELNGNPNVPG